MDGGRSPVRVWDLPVRLVHWLFAVLVIVSWVTAEYGWLTWHRLSGYTILTLVVFRLYWGFFGSTTARFAHFLRGPRTVRRFASAFWSRSDHVSFIGHNPLSGWNIVAILGLLLLQASLGLFAVDRDGMEPGPLAVHVTFDVGRRIAGLHAATFRLLLLFIVLHLVAVAVHLAVKRENLIRPMLTGMMQAGSDEMPALTFASPWRAWLGIAGSVLLILALITAA